jgi:hypothetical protein
VTPAIDSVAGELECGTRKLQVGKLKNKSFDIEGQSRYCAPRLRKIFVLPSVFSGRCSSTHDVFQVFPGSRFLIVGSPREVPACGNFSLTFQGTRK